MNPLPGMAAPQATLTDELLTSLTDVLHDVWGHRAFRPLQLEAISAILSGQDTLIVLPTGGGKSLCYQLPAMRLPGVTVVVSPLLSLMKDQVDAARGLGISASFLNSTQTASEKRETIQQLRDGAVKLLYVSPERLVLPDFLCTLSQVRLSLLAIDEAHCVSQWGHDFRPQYRELSVLREAFPDTPLCALTATATERVRDDIVAQLNLRDPQVFVGRFERLNLLYHAQRKHDLHGQLLKVVRRRTGDAGVIYCITRKDVEEIAELLQAEGVRARPYHAGLSEKDRRTHQEDFLHDEIDVIVATVAFGMGIDKPNVRYVLHAGMPQSIENYQQESGRAGRDGLEAECWLFYGGEDEQKWRRILADQPAQVRQVSLAAVRRMADYCVDLTCRRRALVQHFGQDLEADCGDHCDRCLTPLELHPERLVIAQKILSSVHRQKSAFAADSAAYTAQVVRGASNKRIQQNEHEQLSTFGLLKEYDQATVVDWIRLLCLQGFLARVGEFDGLRITEAGYALLKGAAEPQLPRPDSRRPRKPSKATARNSNASPDREAAATGLPPAHDLFEDLRHFRLELARERGVPPYHIFNDATLRDLVRLQPSTEAELLEVYGIGKKKAADFGQLFLERIARFDRS